MSFYSLGQYISSLPPELLRCSPPIFCGLSDSLTRGRRTRRYQTITPTRRLRAFFSGNTNKTKYPMTSSGRTANGRYETENIQSAEVPQTKHAHMATFNPASFPRRPKRSNIFTEAWYHTKLAYYQYEVNTGMYVMSPGEKTAYNLIVLSLLVLLVSTVYYCRPRTMIPGLERLAYYLTGYYRQSVAVMLETPPIARNIWQSTGEAAASLSGFGISAMNTNISTLTP